MGCCSRCQLQQHLQERLRKATAMGVQVAVHMPVCGMQGCLIAITQLVCDATRIASVCCHFFVLPFMRGVIFA